MRKIIGYFKYENENYQIRLIENKKIGIFKVKDNKLEVPFNLDNELIKKLSKLLNINIKTSYIVDTKTINNQKFNIYYDNSSSLYFWDYTKDEESNIILNFKFNHVPVEVFNDINDQSNKEDYFSKLIRVKNKIIPIFLVASLTISLLIGCIISNPTKTITELKNIFIFEEYDFDQIKKLIEENAYLSNEEKDLINKLQFVFDDYHEYMNMPLIKERLKTLKTQYNLEISSEKNENGIKSVGSYNMEENTMNFNSESFENTDLSTFIHEFFHVLQVIENNDFTVELSNEFFTREVLLRLYKEEKIPKMDFLSAELKKNYINKKIKIKNEEEWLYYISLSEGFGGGYPSYEIIYKFLAELLSKEALLKYQFDTTNLNVLIEDLISIEGNVNENSLKRATNLINKINNLREFDSKKQNYIYKKEGKEILEQLNYYYKIKYNKKIEQSMENGLIILIDINSNILDLEMHEIPPYIVCFSEVYNVSFSYGIGFLTGKTYLSEAFKENILVYNGLNGIETYSINEDLENEIKDIINDLILTL